MDGEGRAEVMHAREVRALRKVRPAERESCRLRTLDGVIMLRADGRPAAGRFPDNVWVVMGSDHDRIEDFFGPGTDVMTVALHGAEVAGSTRFCVGFDTERQRMVMNHVGAYPVYVSGLLRLHRERI